MLLCHATVSIHTGYLATAFSVRILDFYRIGHHWQCGTS